MYKVIGADGKEYGPAAAELLRTWLQEGRITFQSRARLEGTEEWKLLSEFPEFGESEGETRPQAPPAATSLLGSADADAIANDILAEDYHLDIGSCLSRGWDLVTANFWPLVGASLLTFVLVVASSSVPFASLFLAYVFMGGLDWYVLKLIRGERAEISDIFAGFQSWFLPLMLFSIVAQLLTMTGLMLCVLPGIYLMVAWLFFTPLIIMDRNVDFWPAMELSRKVVNRHWWLLFGFMLIQMLIALVGLLACGVGLLIALPWITAATVYAYEDIFTHPRPKPA